jgi:ATP-binding protein involved in chromosome partitioning
MVTSEDIRQALQKVIDPELKRNLVELGMVREVRMEDSQAHLTLALTTLACPLKDQIVADTRQAILSVDGIQQVDVQLTEMTP